MQSINTCPPILQSAQPAILINRFKNNDYGIKFQIQSFMNLKGIKHIQIRVVRQSDNQSIVNTNVDKVPQKYRKYVAQDGIVYIPTWEQDSEGVVKNKNITAMAGANTWQVRLPRTTSIGGVSRPTLLSNMIQPGGLYKIQIRFGSNELWNQTEQGADIKDSDLEYKFVDWKQAQIESQAFGEWSNVMIIKTIDEPEIIINGQISKTNTESIATIVNTEASLTPLITAVFRFQDELSNKEQLDKYKFDLYKCSEDVSNPQPSQLLETTGWLQHNGAVNTADSHIFSQVLENDKIYKVTYYARTVNGYTGIGSYVFMPQESYLEDISNKIQLNVIADELFNKENGCVDIQISTTDNAYLGGKYVLIRSSSKTNFAVWEDLQFFNFVKFSGGPVYRDFTIESGVRYKYALQRVDSQGFRSSPLPAPSLNEPVQVDFEYSYLMRDGIQLRLMFNHQVSSFKHTTLTNKQDTLGGKYPKLARNGNAYYAEFPIKGLISFRMDPSYTFMHLDDNGFTYKDEVVIPREKFESDAVERAAYIGVNGNNEPIPEAKVLETNYNSLTIDGNLTDNNIYVERKFREKVEEFLNDFTYKLYRSPTEGNIVVVLHNVSLTPNATLGRMIYEFSATAYEVLENTLENLNEYGVIHIAAIGNPDAHIQSFNQLAGLYTTTSAIDLGALIKKQETISLIGDYEMAFDGIVDFWVERYPAQETYFSKDVADDGTISINIGKQPINTFKIQDEQVEIKKLAEENNLSSQEILALQEERVKPLQDLQKVVKDNQMNQSWAIIQLQEDNDHNTNILVALNKVYHLERPIKNIILLQAKYPIIFNYVAQTRQERKKNHKLPIGLEAGRIFGQVSGIFTNNIEDIHATFDPTLAEVDVPPYKVQTEENIQFDVYNTLNLFGVIEEYTRHSIEQIYTAERGFVKLEQTQDLVDDNGRPIWQNDSYRYRFSGIVYLEIEAQPGTELIVTSLYQQTDDNNHVTNMEEELHIKINKSGRYQLGPLADKMIQDIRFAEPSYAIVTFKSLTTQELFEEGSQRV